MKLLATAVFAGTMVFGTAACAKEEPKKTTPAATQSAPATSANDKKAEAPKTKKTCIKTTDAKTGKEVEKCKTVTLHEKHEGTKVPEKAPKK